MAIDHKDKLVPGRLWAAGQVMTGQEIEVADRLAEAGLAESYCPKRRLFVRPRLKRKAKEKSVAMFPGYIFALEDSLVDLEAIYDTPGFMHFLRYMDDGRLQTIPDAKIQSVRLRERRGISLSVDIETLFQRFEIGQRVRVVDGAFGGLTGTVVSQDKGRVIVAGGDFNIGAELPAELLVLEE